MKVISRKEARLLGLKRFFTGVPCPRGHVADRGVVNGTCTECISEKNRERAARNKLLLGDTRSPREIAVANGYTNYFTGKPCGNGHIDERRTSDAKCRSCIKIKNRIKNVNRKDYMKAFIAAAQAKRRCAVGVFSKSDVVKKLEQQKFKCVACNTNIKKTYHVDHIVPLARGGTNWPSNIQCLCPQCNLSKNAKDPIKWAQENGRLL